MIALAGKNNANTASNLSAKTKIGQTRAGEHDGDERQPASGSDHCGPAVSQTIVARWLA